MNTLRFLFGIGFMAIPPAFVFRLCPSREARMSTVHFMAHTFAFFVAGMMIAWLPSAFASSRGGPPPAKITILPNLLDWIELRRPRARQCFQKYRLTDMNFVLLAYARGTRKRAHWMILRTRHSIYLESTQTRSEDAVWNCIDKVMNTPPYFDGQFIEFNDCFVLVKRDSVRFMNLELEL